MASIEKRNGKLKVRWRGQDGRAHSRTVPTARAARQLQKEIEEAISLGREWQPDRAGQALDLTEIHRAYLSEIAAYRKAGTVSSIASRLTIWERWLHETYPDQRLPPSLLSRGVLARFLLSLQGTGRRGARKPATCAAILSTVQTLWRWASDDPLYGALVERPRPLPAPAVPLRDVWAPSWAEMDAAIRCAEGYTRQAAVIGRYTGLRVNQIFGLRWDDLRGLELTVRGELGKSRQEQGGRVIPISPHLAAELATWERVGPMMVTAPAEWAAFYARRTLLKAWEQTGIQGSPWRGRPFHVLRSGLQTGLANAGVREDTIRFLVGHSRGIAAHYIDGRELARRAVEMIPPIDWKGLKDGPVSLMCPAESGGDKT